MIKEQNSLKKELEQSRSLLEEAQEAGNIGHWEFKLNEEQLIWSDQLYRIYGYEPGEIKLDQSFLLQKTTHPSDLKRIQEVIDSALFNKEGYSFDRMIIRKDGTSGFANTKAKVEVLNGKVIRIMGITQDITKRKNTELLLKGVLNSSLSGIEAYEAVRNSEGKIIDFKFLLLNAVAEKFKGRSSAELIGKNFLEEYPQAIKSGLLGIYVNVIESGGPLNIEHGYLHKGQKLILKASAVKYNDGFVLTFEDITVKKKLEKELLDSQLKQQKELLQAELRTREDEKKRIARALHSGLKDLIKSAKVNMEFSGIEERPKINIHFSPREKEVLELIAEGLTNIEIAEKLFMSKRTAESHRNKLLEKTSSKNTAALIKYGIVNGLIKL